MRTSTGKLGGSKSPRDRDRRRDRLRAGRSPRISALTDEPENGTPDEAEDLPPDDPRQRPTGPSIPLQVVADPDKIDRSKTIVTEASTTDGLAYRDKQPKGSDYVCGSCGYLVAVGVEKPLMNTVIVCYCGELNGF